MYLDNKYTRIYYSIIDRAKNRVLNGYTEKHHIIPKSIGGSNTKDNLVKLTPREHFICHLLLPKMLEGLSRRKMTFALTNFTNRARHGSTSIYKIGGRSNKTIKRTHRFICRQFKKVAHLTSKAESKLNKISEQLEKQIQSHVYPQLEKCLLVLV